MTHASILARLQCRELLRRRLALALLVGMPITFYLTSLGTDDGTDGYSWAAVSGAIGMGFAVCGAAFFSMLAGRGVDPRLVLIGWQPAELILGRLLLLGGVATAIGAGFFALMELTWWPAYPGALAAAIAMAALVSVTAGLAIAALVPKEMEGILVVILFVGLQMGVPPSTSAGPYVPFYGPQELLVRAVSGGPLLGPMLHAGGWAVALLAVAVTVWRRRLRLRAPTEDVGAPGSPHGSRPRR